MVTLYIITLNLFVLLLRRESLYLHYHQTHHIFLNHWTDNVFNALKQCWDVQCNSFMLDNPGKTVTLYQFSELFAVAWKNAMTPQNITS